MKKLQFKLKRWFRSIIIKHKTAQLKETKLTRHQLRAKKVYHEKKLINAMDFIDMAASKIQKLTPDIDQRTNLRNIYYKYDIAGLNLYINEINIAFNLKKK
jgi:hypothetical protein